VTRRSMRGSKRAALTAIVAVLAITAPPAAAQPPGVPPPAPPAPRVTFEEPRFDVGLAWDQDTVAITPANGGLKLYVSSESGDQPLADRAAWVDARRVGGEWEISWSEGEGAIRSAALPVLDTLWISGAGAADPAAPAMRWNGKRWRGMGKVFVGPRGRLTLAVRVPLEAYMLGVIPAEIGALAPELLQAGRAQAIAARSYSMFYRGRRGAEGFDLYGTVEDQVYGPVESERPLATQCVESTQGWLALHQGQPIRANYSSTCGGITSDVWEAWPTPPMAYLVSHVDRGPAGDYCAASPHHRWRETWTAAELASNLATYGRQFGVRLPARGVGELVDVRVDRRSRSGRSWQLVVRTTTGRIVVPAYVTRQVLRRGGNAAAILRSNLFKIDVRRDPATRRAIEVIATGAGNGHGVGLCQTGALGMARAGRPAEAILQHYFRGVDIRKLY
jgi:stage II sporulation protein D